MTLGGLIIVSLVTAILGWLFGAFVVRRQMPGRFVATILLPIAAIFAIQISSRIGDPPAEAGWQAVLVGAAVLYAFFSLSVSLLMAFIMERGWGYRAP